MECQVRGYKGREVVCWQHEWKDGGFEESKTKMELMKEWWRKQTQKSN